MVPFSFPGLDFNTNTNFKKILPRVVLARGGYRGCGSEKAPHPILAPHLVPPHLSAPSKKCLAPHLKKTIRRSLLVVFILLVKI